jgi:hypothetical protein
MRLTQKTEWIVIGVIIAYIAFFSKKHLLSTPIAKLAGLIGIVFAWKNLSPVISVLLAVAFVLSLKHNIWEGMAVSPAACSCEEGYVYDSSTKKCKNSTGDAKDPKACTCDSGYAYDMITKQCTQATVMQDPIPLTSVSPIVSANEAAAPAITAGPTTSTAPMTTPGAAQAMATSTPPSTTATTSGPVPSENFDLMHAYPLH